MTIPNPAEIAPRATSPYTAAEVADILRVRGWLGHSDSAELHTWLSDVAALLGRPAATREALADSLGLIFNYDARAILNSPESHAVRARQGARDVIRELALLVLGGPDIDSDRLKEIVTGLKENVRLRSRELLHPLRLALAGRSGEGDLDRVILLLDRTARLALPQPVKSCRQRMLEFCAALDS